LSYAARNRAIGHIMLAAMIGVHASSAQRSVDYPWYLDAGGNESQFNSCAFNSFDQCMQTGWGDGGFCYRNPSTGPCSRGHA
jgi:hypothetical protein